MIVKIDKRIVKRIEEFADKRIEGSKSLYAHRGEARVEKIRNDIIIGAMGEFAIKKVLKDMKLKCTDPDLKIYEGRKKSFEADLFCEKKNIHVKSQSTFSAERYGYSWLCQRTDPLYKDPQENDLFAFNCVDLEKREVTFLGFCKASDIKKYDLWKECKVPMFRRTKIALYLTDFADYDILSEELL